MDTLISPPPALSTTVTKVAAITASAFLAGAYEYTRKSFPSYQI